MDAKSQINSVAAGLEGLVTLLSGQNAQIISELGPRLAVIENEIAGIKGILGKVEIKKMPCGKLSSTDGKFRYNCKLPAEIAGPLTIEVTQKGVKNQYTVSKSGNNPSFATIQDNNTVQMVFDSAPDDVAIIDGTASLYDKLKLHWEQIRAIYAKLQELFEMITTLSENQTQVDDNISNTIKCTALQESQIQQLVEKNERISANITKINKCLQAIADAIGE